MEFAKIKSELTIKRVFNVLLIFAAFMLLGLMNFATLKFDIERLKDIGLWTSTTIKVLAFSAIYLSVSSETNERMLITDTSYTNKQDANEKMAAASRPDVCNEYLVGYNRHIKSEKFREQINIKLSKIARRENQKRNIEWAKYVKFQNDYANDNSILPPKFSRRVLRKARLLERQSDKWIKEHIDEIYIKYDETFYSELTSGIKSGGYGTSPLKKSGAAHQATHVFSMIVRTFAMMILSSSIVAEFIEPEIILEPLLNLSITIFLVLWNIVSAKKDGKIQFKTIEMPKVDFKQSILKQYIKYEQEKYHYNIWFDEKGNICSDSAKLRENYTKQ